METEVSSLQKALNKLNPGTGSTEGSVRYSYGIHVPFIMPCSQYIVSVEVRRVTLWCLLPKAGAVKMLTRTYLKGCNSQLVKERSVSYLQAWQGSCTGAQKKKQKKQNNPASEQSGTWTYNVQHANYLATQPLLTQC